MLQSTCEPNLVDVEQVSDFYNCYRVSIVETFSVSDVGHSETRHHLHFKHANMFYDPAGTQRWCNQDGVTTALQTWEMIRPQLKRKFKKKSVTSESIIVVGSLLNRNYGLDWGKNPAWWETERLSGSHQKNSMGKKQKQKTYCTSRSPYLTCQLFKRASSQNRPIWGFQAKFGL